jgi:hypothetical protein
VAAAPLEQLICRPAFGPAVRSKELPLFFARKREKGNLSARCAAGLIAAALVKGPSKKVPPICVWIDASDFRTFADIERDRLIQRLIPRGRYTMTLLASLLSSQHIERADQPVPVGDQGASFLYVPE